MKGDRARPRRGRGRAGPPAGARRTSARERPALAARVAGATASQGAPSEIAARAQARASARVTRTGGRRDEQRFLRRPDDPRRYPDASTRSSASTRCRQTFDVARLPYSLKVLLENALRLEDGESVTAADVEAIASWDAKAEPSDGDPVPAGAGADAGLHRRARRSSTWPRCATRSTSSASDPAKINPLVPVDLVIDHSVQVDAFGNARAFDINADRDYERNGERYAFLRWGQQAFDNFRVVPPATGICHQVNLEYLGQVVFSRERRRRHVRPIPDTLVGTDSHTTMINGLGVLGWGVGGIEAEAAMLGQPISMLLPQVVGFRLDGELPEGATATDLVLTVTEMLRERGVVGQVRRVLRPGPAHARPRRPGDDRQHVAGVRLDLRDLPGRPRDPPLPRVHRPARPS